ncbi:MAG: signal recognition particle protein [Planctomycetota bacterium]|nr:signal recognition particle protein [Planctomycetota bacterium]
MFNALSDRFSKTFRNLSGRGRISDANVREAMDEIHQALLEADVNLDVVNSFCEQVQQEALGEEVLQSLKPGQQMIQIVHQHLVDLMGPVDSHVMLVDPPPTIIMLCGLQGTGKTTTCGKLAAYLKRNGRNTLVCAADLQRPAAVEQLRVVVEGVEEKAKGNATVAFHGEPDKCAEYGTATGVAIGVCQRALKRAKSERFDVLILDTAGRLHVDDDLMKELDGVRFALNPHQIYLVVDAMTGQDAVQSARAFNERMSVDGVILTKLDSDTRGGAALSVKKVTGAPIKFIGVGDGYDALEEFHPERMAGRILGMGDVVSLVEKAQQEVDEEEAEAMAERLAKGQFTMDDFVKQIRSLRRMGPLKQIMGMIPGVGSAIKNLDGHEGQLDRIEAIVGSMTQQEREDSVLLKNKSRVRRIARGSAASGPEVNKLLKQFDMIKKMSTQMAGMGMLGKMKAMKGMQNEDAMAGMEQLAGMSTRGSTKTSSIKKKFKKRKRR